MGKTAITEIVSTVPASFHTTACTLTAKYRIKYSGHCISLQISLAGIPGIISRLDITNPDLIE
jgi:hypothetical protein